MTLELTFSGDTNLLRDASTTTISLAAGTKYVVGRQPQREGFQWVQLSSSAVNFSREQFTITNDGAGWQLRSEGTNATKVNGTQYKKGERCSLEKDDNISVLGTQQGGAALKMKIVDRSSPAPESVEPVYVATLRVRHRTDGGSLQSEVETGSLTYIQSQSDLRTQKLGAIRRIIEKNCEREMSGFSDGFNFVHPQFNAPIPMPYEKGENATLGKDVLIKGSQPMSIQLCHAMPASGADPGGASAFVSDPAAWGVPAGAEGDEAAPAAAEGEAAPSGKRPRIKSAFDRFVKERSPALDVEGFEGKKMDKIRAEWKDPPNDTIAARKRELEAEVEAEKKARPPPEKKRQKKGAAAPPPAAEPEAEAEEGAGMQVECLDD